MATVSSPNRLRLLAGTLGVLCLLVGTIAPADAAGLSVTSVRFWSMGEVTRVAIEVSGDFRYSSDRIPNPDRLFYDIQGAQSKLRDKGTYVVPVGDKLLRQIRVGADATSCDARRVRSGAGCRSGLFTVVESGPLDGGVAAQRDAASRARRAGNA